MSTASPLPPAPRSSSGALAAWGAALLVIATVLIGALAPARHAAPDDRGLRVPLAYQFASADAPFAAQKWAARAGEGAQASYELVGLLHHAWPRRPCVHVDGARGVPRAIISTFH